MNYLSRLSSFTFSQMGARSGSRLRIKNKCLSVYLSICWFSFISSSTFPCFKYFNPVIHFQPTTILGTSIHPHLAGEPTKISNIFYSPWLTKLNHLNNCFQPHTSNKQMSCFCFFQNIFHNQLSLLISFLNWAHIKPRGQVAFMVWISSRTPYAWYWTFFETQKQYITPPKVTYYHLIYLALWGEVQSTSKLGVQSCLWKNFDLS